MAAGDDADPHVVEVPAGQPLGEVVAGLLERRYLATVAGGQATWVLVGGGRALAVVAQQWAEPRYLVDPATPVGGSLLFRYLQQRDPEQVYAGLAS